MCADSVQVGQKKLLSLVVEAFILVLKVSSV